jgi:hypothetical protein
MRATTMDRALTRKERFRAKAKPVFLLAAFLFCWVALFVYGTNHDQIAETFVKVRDTVCHIIDAVSVFFSSLKAA